MDIQEERASFENFNEPNSSCSGHTAEIRKTVETKAVLRFIEQDVSIRSLIERHYVSEFQISSAETEEFVCPIELDDDCAVILAAIRLKMSYMRKYLGEHIPCNTLSIAENPTDAPMSISFPSGEVGYLQNPGRRLQEPIPFYYSYLLLQTLVRPLTYSIFMKQIFTILLRVYVKLSTDFEGILESVQIDRLPVSEEFEDPLLHTKREVTAIGICLKNNIKEFVRICSKCETFRRHFVEVILDTLPLKVHNFKKERLTYDYLEHLVSCLENIVNHNISTLKGYSNEIYKLSLYLKSMNKF